MVLVDRQLAELDTDLVGLDNADAVEQALDHLQHRGFRDILLVTEPLDGTSSRIERVQGLQCLHRPATGAQGPGPANRRLLPRRPARLPFGQRPRAEGAVHLQRRRHLSAPPANCATSAAGCSDEVGLLALDELDWYPLVGSGITALAQPTDEIGRTAFERLLARLEGDREPARRVTFPAQLIVRGSTHPRGLSARRRRVAGGFRTA